MTDRKISELTNITGANLADSDEFPVVDTSADETKAITFGELKSAFDTSTGFVRITGDTMTGDLTVPNVITSGNVDGRDVSADGTKLDTIETNADVTDTANVTSAGALMTTGGTLTGDVSFGDNDKAIFGAGSDLQIYHDGSNSYIQDAGTGNLNIQANQLRIQTDTGENFIECVPNAQVVLRYDNAVKMQTTSTGIDVTGTVTADGLAVDGLSTLNGRINIGGSTASLVTGSSDPQIFRTTTGDGYAFGDLVIQGRSDTGGRSVYIAAGATPANRVRVQDNGDISFYEDTGTTPKFFWDASAELLDLSTGLTVGSPSNPTSSKAIVKVADSASAIQAFEVTNRVNADFVFKVESNLVTGGSTIAKPIAFMTSNTERMRIDSSGNVGIGTSSPAHDLQIGSGTNSATLGLKGSTVGPIKPKLTFEAQDGSDRYIWEYTPSGNPNSDLLSLSTNNNAHALTVLGSGNVGIGTSSPDQRLTVSGTTTQQIKIIATEDGSDMRVGASSFGSGSGFVGTVSNHPVTFITNNTERMRIDSSGRVLVGTTSVPSTSVKGWAVRPYASGVFVTSSINSTGSLTHYEFVNPNGQVGSINTSGSATSYNTSSDYRLKTDAQPMTGASARVQALNPVNFEWIADGTRVDGFLAHEAQEVVPEAVTGEKDGEEMQAIDQSKLVPLLTAALQEALTKIDALEARIITLEG